MNNECSIVRDLLPLYTEDMVSEETAAFVRGHLAHCEACRAEHARMSEPARAPAPTETESGEVPLTAFRRRWNRRKRRMIGLTALLTAVLVLLASYFLGSGFMKRGDVVLLDYAVSEDGTTLTFQTAVVSSMGYTRGFSDRGGGVKPHCLDFYATFGGLNSSLGARSEFTLTLDEEDTEIFFTRPRGGSELVLEKNADGVWQRPAV